MIINHRWNLYSHLLGLITGTLYILVDCYAILFYLGNQVSGHAFGQDHYCFLFLDVSGVF